MRTNYDKKIIDYAIEHSTEYNVKEWQQIMKDKFDVQFNQKQMRHFFYMRGLKVKTTNKNRRSFNQKMYDYLMEHGEEHIVKEWVEIINKKYNEEFTLKELQHYFVRHKIPYKYEMEYKSNDGTALPIGSERTKSDGMVQIKVAPHKWEYKQRYIYEKYYGVELKEDEYVIFLDQNRNNFDINNLKVCTSSETATMNALKIFSTKREVTELSIEVAKLRNKIIKKQRNEE